MSFNVLFITGSLENEASGPFLSLNELVDQFINYGTSVQIIGDITTKSKDFSAKFHNSITIKVRNIFNGSPHFSLGIWHALKSVNRPDIVIFHTPWNLNNLVVYKWCIKENIPYVISIRGSLSEFALQVKKIKKYFMINFLFKKMLKNCAFFHALNATEYKDTKKMFPNKKVLIIPNGINKVLTTRNYLGFKTVTYLGRIFEGKGIKELLIAWNKVHEKYPTWHLNIAGPDNNEFASTLKRYVIENNLEKSVSFLGPVYDKHKTSLFEHTSFLILPSFSEGMPMAPLEAMMYGVPILCTAQSNLDFLRESNGGIIIDYPDPNLIELGLLEMIAMGDEALSKMGENARAYCEENLSWDVITEKFINYLKKESVYE